MRVSSNYFHLLGIQPAVGRDFHATADNPNDWRVVLIISYSVAERTREIGIRAALGASRTDIVRLVLGGGLGVVAIGVAAGVAIALAATRYLHGSLYNVSATDPSTIAVVAVALFAIAAIAQGVPMARAMRVEPSVALRHD